MTEHSVRSKGRSNDSYKIQEANIPFQQAFLSQEAQQKRFCRQFNYLGDPNTHTNALLRKLEDILAVPMTGCRRQAVPLLPDESEWAVINFNRKQDHKNVDASERGW